ncbi:MAG: hypothetical protein JJE01_13875 [Gemmatimonadetes bacterium]|nr:hypothetical protein [Gemmatimonadota bacterium]
MKKWKSRESNERGAVLFLVAASMVVIRGYPVTGRIRYIDWSVRAV